MKLLNKLLRHHISPAQFIGFFLANLVGVSIVIAGIQFYIDIKPLFSDNDTFMKAEYVIISKKVSTLGSLGLKKSEFSKREIEKLKALPTVKNVGAFTPSKYDVYAGVGGAEIGASFSTQMFFEAVPDNFVDVKSGQWRFNEKSHVIPIILPKNYLNLYNFGFARSRSMPQLSENMLSLVGMNIVLEGTNGRHENYTGRIVGFSNRINTILVPQKFIEYSNEIFAPGSSSESPSRLIIESVNPADGTLKKYLDSNGYEAEGESLNNGKALGFLKLMTGVVMAIGIIISILSLFILMLSVFLLLQKDTEKLKNLILMGYTPMSVSRPYITLSLWLIGAVSIASLVVVWFLRMLYIDAVSNIWNSFTGETFVAAIGATATIFLITSLINIIVISRKISRL